MNEPNIKITGRKLQFSESLRRLNPELFALGGVRPAEHKPDGGRALEQKAQTAGSRGRRLARRNAPVLRVRLIRVGRGVQDSDNLAAGFKPLRDSIANRFGLDDEDGTIQWRYGQCEDFDRSGAIVMMEILGTED